MTNKMLDPTLGILRNIVSIALCAWLAGCASPHRVDVDLNEALPQNKATSFDQALRDFGLMTKIYGSQDLHIMVQQIIDNTGTSIATSAEIPRDITEMTKSTLNSFGGNIVYVPYDPEFILNSAKTGYSGFDKRIKPNVVVAGGITEFDRGLETRGRNTDIGLTGQIQDNELGADFSRERQTSLASITLDYNLIDFESLAGISQVQAINSIKVNKALAEDSLGFSIIGNAFGLKGSVKKVQGRHAAVRLLVQASMVQMIGKYLRLPYWRLLPGAQVDAYVVTQLSEDFDNADAATRLRKLQELLMLHGYSVAFSTQLDDATALALQAYRDKHAIVGTEVDLALYLSLYENVPLTSDALRARVQLRANKDTKKVAASVNLNIAPATTTQAVAKSTETAPQTNASANSRDGKLHIWTATPNYRVGDKVRVYFQVSAPMYVKIYNIGPDGEVDVLYPNTHQPATVLSPSQQYETPPSHNPFELQITGPAGIDRIVAVATTQPITDDAKITEQLRSNSTLSNESATSAQLSLKVD